MIGDVWQELGEGIFRRRYETFDQNVGVVLGAEAAVLIDSRANPTAARELRSELEALTSQPVGWLFNTHYHWDHTFGNQVFPEATIWGHEECRRMLVDHGTEMVADLLPSLNPAGQEAMKDLVITPPTRTFTDRVKIDIGNRMVDVAYFGRGHTNSDAVLHVDGVTFAGDLIEEGGPPSVGDSFPIAWVETVGRLANEARPVVVPGHGDIVDVEYVVVTRFDLSWLAHAAEEAWTRGVRVEEVDLAGAPYPEEVTREAIARAYSELESRSKLR
jgi:glyoxylase-like metal-dependent hydrolase (beta-lactamase superfamily II)